MKRGMVIGKFLPPHKGHSFLISTALTKVDHLTVIVCDLPGQPIPGRLRAAWLREIHPTVEVRVVPDIGRDDDSAAWAEYTKLFLGFVPDVVFTSESYGPRYAECLACEHVMVDALRTTVPISATRVREDPIGNWEFLAPPVRAHYARRVCVLGAESTGTTTMAMALADHFRTTWVPEFGRVYTEAKRYGPDASVWRTSEFTFIAEGQNRLEDQLAGTCNRLLICDTDAFATALWHERYLGFGSPEVEATGVGRRMDLYLLTDVDIPFVQDGTRDGEHIRHAMHRRFVEELERRSKSWLLLSGTHETRLRKAVEACEQVLVLSLPPFSQNPRRRTQECPSG